MWRVRVADCMHADIIFPIFSSLVGATSDASKRRACVLNHDVSWSISVHSFLQEAHAFSSLSSLCIPPSNLHLPPASPPLPFPPPPLLPPFTSTCLPSSSASSPSSTIST